MILFIIFILFLSSVAGVESEGEKVELSMLLRRISDLEERLHKQERVNEEQNTIIKTLLLEKTETDTAQETEIVTSIQTEQNEGSQWDNGDLENNPISGEGARGVNVGIKSQTVATIQSLVKDLKETSRKIQRGVVAGDVAFYSYLSHHETNPGHHQTIIFDHVVINVGGNYNHHSGIFNSPGNGVYTFSWTLYCTDGGYFTTELVVNSNPVGGAYCDAQGANYIRHTLGVVVVEINPGDIVYVRTSPTDNMAGYIFSNLSARTTFSGWKLF
ncbi:uncharacterized protein LOC130049047 [Ostrea edulis]|uniref:uncharacterized protein LOC130049047 n=1 Tax=Ostrea edulis TaxID=37623 RepID=UPI0024AEF74C|nr:uncharacterized protein LOC130049047 [Ostrea edulis]